MQLGLQGDVGICLVRTLSLIQCLGLVLGFIDYMTSVMSSSHYHFIQSWHVLNGKVKSKLVGKFIVMVIFCFLCKLMFNLLSFWCLLFKEFLCFYGNPCFRVSVIMATMVFSYYILTGLIWEGLNGNILTCICFEVFER